MSNDNSTSDPSRSMKIEAMKARLNNFKQTFGEYKENRLVSKNKKLLEEDIENELGQFNGNREANANLSSILSRTEDSGILVENRSLTNRRDVPKTQKFIEDFKIVRTPLTSELDVRNKSEKLDEERVCAKSSTSIVKQSHRHQLVKRNVLNTKMSTSQSIITDNKSSSHIQIITDSHSLSIPESSTTSEKHSSSDDKNRLKSKRHPSVLQQLWDNSMNNNTDKKKSLKSNNVTFSVSKEPFSKDKDSPRALVTKTKYSSTTPNLHSVINPHLPLINPDTIYVNGKPYQRLNCIGRGGTCEVFQVFDHSTGLVVALKIVTFNSHDEQRDSYINEIDLLRRMQSSNKVIKYFDHELNEAENRLYIVLEKGDSDLNTFLRKYRGNEERLSSQAIVYYWIEMLKCVRAIHDFGVVHSDLKAANFLLVGGCLKLIDFGIARSLPDEQTSVCFDRPMGTLNYMAPEVLEPYVTGNPLGRLSLKVDIWSLGCILYLMIYGRCPFGHLKGDAVKIGAIYHCKDGDINYDPSVDKNINDTLRLCLKRNPQKRPTTNQLLLHPYVTSADPSNGKSNN